ncbi:MAG: RDD family protein [Xanthomonadales bacterium]|nr:RDD family protein [Xanthomonadales bacterium]
MNRSMGFLVVVGALLLSAMASSGRVGVTWSCVNSECLVAASSSALSIAISVGLVLLLLLIPRQQCAPASTRVVGAVRRLGAFLLDFTVAVLIASPLLAMPMLMAEANHSGAFAWSFERDFSRQTDSAHAVGGVGCVFIALFLHFYLPSRMHRPTIGQFVLGYQIRPNGGRHAPMYATRVVLSCIGLCAWPMSVLLAMRRANKAFWWDVMTETTAVRSTVDESTVTCSPIKRGPG